MKVRKERLIHPWSPEYSPFGGQRQKGAPLPGVSDRASLRRMKLLLKSQRYYQLHPEERRESSRKWRLSHPEAFQAYKKQYNQTHREENTVRERGRRRRLGAVPQEIISLQRRERENLVMMLKQEGHPWREIAVLTRQPEAQCVHMFTAAKRRLGIPIQQQRADCDDATLLATYHDGMSFAELGRRLGYANRQAAAKAYKRALARATGGEDAAWRRTSRERWGSGSSKDVAIQRRGREERALSLYRVGMTWKELGERLGVSDVGARLIYLRAMKRQQQESEVQQ